ncbi:MAG: hypothetical protein GX151_00565 [Gammaproteobacteria bacterium]|nr:hypothetical protein [Gammaproteobacteria bacterium]
MAIQQINLGSRPKGVGGDNSREAGEKINANFEDLDERVALAKSVADSKTTNATDAHLLNRSNHTGTQSISTILGLQAALDSAASQIDITGNAATATKLATPVQINGVDFDGSQSISIVIPGGGTGGSTSYADTAGKLANPVQIHGVNFDGGSGFDIPNFTATKSGVVPAAGLDTTKYLRSDGTWQAPTDTTYTIFGASPGLVPAKVGSTTTKFLREDGAWVIPTDTQYTAMTATAANTGTATTAQIISPSVLKQAIQTHAPTGSGMNFSAKAEIELEIVFDFVSGTYHTSGNILAVSNQANIASAVIDNNGILCLTFNTPISNPNLIATTKSEVKTVTHEGVDYWYLTSVAGANFNSFERIFPNTFSILQYAEKGYVNTNTKLYIAYNLGLVPDYDDNTQEPLGTYTLYSAFPANFNLGIIDA